MKRLGLAVWALSVVTGFAQPPPAPTPQEEVAQKLEKFVQKLAEYKRLTNEEARLEKEVARLQAQLTALQAKRAQFTNSPAFRAAVAAQGVPPQGTNTPPSAQDR